jgi:hypothetical protein
MSQDLWDKAAECARAIVATNNPFQREMLTHLQTLWTNLANESQVAGGDHLADQIAGISKIHAYLVRPVAGTADETGLSRSAASL